LAIVLVFIGGKMIGEPWVHISVGLSLGVVGGVLLIALLASVLIPGKKKPKVQSSSNISSST
jgi:tellurite resistance protein TerC